MRFSEAWLREWVNPPVSTRELAQQLTMAGLEVDAVEPAAPAFTDVVVGEILAADPHPDADKLRVCRVDAGKGEPLQVVCGAPNARIGLRVALACEGARLPGEVRIRHARLRGVESCGMLCSARELGLSEESSGLMELPADAPVGADLRVCLGLDDSVFELDLTPNRGDCLGIAGIAREVGALNRCAVTPPPTDSVAVTIPDRFPVVVEAGEDCPRYLGRVIRGVDPDAPTPLWMRERLRRSGMRSLGALVDVTNYLLLESGQPMHAFDLAQLAEGIRVRRARAGERLTLLDDREVELQPDTLVIADAKRVLALAGIMGGAQSAVGAGTCDVFLECAFFAPASIAGRARRYGLHTDSSHRFERGVDPSLQAAAMERATALLTAIAGGRAGPVVEAAAPEHLPGPASVPLRAARIGRLLGITLAPESVEEILARLGMGPEREEGGWRVTVPTHRFDITTEVDLVEELARVHGYDRLPSTRPAGTAALPPQPEGRLGRERICTALVDRGYQEVVTYSFVDADLQHRLDPVTPAPALTNPLSAELGVLRTGLWPGLLKVLIHNRNRQQSRVRIFEAGLKFIQQQAVIKEENIIGGLAAGGRYPEQWGVESQPVDFYDVKSDLEGLFDLTGRKEGFIFTAASHPALHPGQAARIVCDGMDVGWLGALHPVLQRDLELSERTILFEVSLDALQRARVPSFQEWSRFPANRRDLAVVVDETVSASAVRACIERHAPGVLQEAILFDVYQGKGVELGRRSIAFGLIFQDSSRTLTDQDMDAILAGVVAGLEQELSATLRG